MTDGPGKYSTHPIWKVKENKFEVVPGKLQTCLDVDVITISLGMRYESTFCSRKLENFNLKKCNNH